MVLSIKIVPMCCSRSPSCPPLNLKLGSVGFCLSREANPYCNVIESQPDGAETGAIERVNQPSRPSATRRSPPPCILSTVIRSRMLCPRSAIHRTRFRIGMEILSRNISPVVVGQHRDRSNLSRGSFSGLRAIKRIQSVLWYGCSQA